MKNGLIIEEIEKGASFKINSEICQCPKLKCSHHGKCEECKSLYQNKRALPFCERRKYRKTKKLTISNRGAKN